MTQVVPGGWKERFMERGRAEGEARGEAKGRWAEKLENALNFLKENISVETVARCTGLTPEKVREPAAGLKKNQSRSVEAPLPRLVPPRPMDGGFPLRRGRGRLSPVHLRTSWGAGAAACAVLFLSRFLPSARPGLRRMPGLRICGRDIGHVGLRGPSGPLPPPAGVPRRA